RYTEAICRRTSVSRICRPRLDMKPHTRASTPKPQNELTRRTFIKAGTAAAALGAASWNRVVGANERVGIGVIGFGLVGRIHSRNFKAQPDAQVVAVSEAYRPRLDAAADLVGGRLAQYPDFRKLPEDT